MAALVVTNSIAQAVQCGHQKKQSIKLVTIPIYQLLKEYNILFLGDKYGKSN